MDEALRALLVNNPDLALLVGERVFWDAIPQGTEKPAIVMYLVSSPPDYHMAGASGLVQSRVQIDYRAATRTAALKGDRAVEAVLSGFRGVEGGVKFKGIFKLGGESSFERTEAETFFLRSSDYQIWSGSAA